MAKAPKMTAQDRQWRAQNALETITRAAEIQKDRALMAEVRKIAEQQVKTLSAVTSKTPRATKPR
jgi:hypothetical protein